MVPVGQVSQPNTIENEILIHDSPSVQICLISATLFFNPGLYLAVTVGEFQTKTLASALLINHSCWALVADALPQPLWATSRTVSFTGESDSALSTYTSIPKVQNSIFAFSAVAAGPLLNKIGPRWTLMFGITGYPIYQGAMWYFDESGLLWYPILAGAYLGLSAVSRTFGDCRGNSLTLGPIDFRDACGRRRCLSRPLTQKRGTRAGGALSSGRPTL